MATGKAPSRVQTVDGDTGAGVSPRSKASCNDEKRELL